MKTIILAFLAKIFTKERIWWIIAIILLLAVIGVTIGQYNRMMRKYDAAVQNNKAFAAQIDQDQRNSVVFQTTISQLRYLNDSISQKLIETQKKLGIKNKQVKELTYLSMELSRIDTVTFVDTIFREHMVDIDTVIGDKWMNTHLVFKYPNKVTIEPKTVSEKEVILYSKRETVEPPKKFFLARWFQKRHTVIHAVVNEENPYIINQTNSFFQIQD